MSWFLLERDHFFIHFFLDRSHFSVSSLHIIPTIVAKLKTTFQFMSRSQKRLRPSTENAEWDIGLSTKSHGN